MSQRLVTTALLFIMSLVSFGAQAHLEPGRGHLAEVTTSALNVRTGPGVGYRPISVLHGGDKVRITDHLRGWYQIRHHRLIGWVSARYLRRVTRHLHDDRHPAFAQIGPNRFGFANMFDGPGRDNHLIARLYVGERVRVIERGPRWSYVGKKGIGRGYVRSRFLVRW